MKSELFKLQNIVSPGRIEVFGHGTIVLEEAPDSLLEELFNKGCKYLQPTVKGFKTLYPNRPRIEINTTPFIKKQKKKK